ncbi:MAG: tetratricopeptide repeat protein, partial [Syntrophothermus sp.]
MILLSAGASAQSLRIDRSYLSHLKMQAASEKDERNRCRWFNLIAEEYIKSYTIDSSKHYSYMSLKLASVKGWSSEEAAALKNLVKANRANQFNSEYLTTRRESFESINRAIELYTKLGDKRNLAECYFLYGTYFKFHAKYDQVFEYNAKAREIYSSLHDSAGTAMCLGYLGGLYHATGKPDSARICFESSMKVFEALRDTDQLTYILQGFSYLKTDEKKPAEALALMERAAGFAEGSENLFMIADIYNDYAASLIAAGRNDEAITKLNKAHAIALRFGAQRLLAIICGNLSAALMNKGDYRQSAMYKDSV